jgi:hypothetical protein
MREMEIDEKELKRRKFQRIYQWNAFMGDLRTLKDNIREVVDCFNARLERIVQYNMFQDIIESDLQEMEQRAFAVYDLAKTIHNYVEYWQKKDWHDE